MHKLSIAALLVGLGSLIACAPARPAASAGGEVPSTDTRDDATSESPSAAAADSPAGDLVCRLKSNDGRVELYLKWADSDATGVLRTVGASGAITDTRVRAERSSSAIIVDELNSTDLASHLATVVANNGKRRMRVVEMGNTRSAECE